MWLVVARGAGRPQSSLTCPEAKHQPASLVPGTSKAGWLISDHPGF